MRAKDLHSTRRCSRGNGHIADASEQIEKRQSFKDKHLGFLKNSLLWRLLRESIPSQRKKYTIAVVAMVLVAATTSAAAWIMGEIVDAMTVADESNRVFWVAGGVVLIFTLKGFASFIQVVYMTRAGNRIVAAKQLQMFEKLLGQGVAYFSQEESSDILMRMTQSAQRARSVIDTIVNTFVKDLLSLIGLLAIMFYQQPVLSLFCLTIGPFVIYGLRVILARVREIMGQELAGMAEIIRVVQETSRGARVVKAFALEDRMSVRMETAVRTVEDRANKMARLQAATTPLMDTLTGFAIALIVVLSAVKLFGQEAGTPGQLMSFVTALLMAYEPAKRLSRMRVAIESGLIGVRMMYQMIDQPVTMLDDEGAIPLAKGPGELRLDTINFSYSDESPVIDGLSFVFEAGKTTALVGPSGGGKSTMMNLAMRLYDPTSGRVLIDGQDIRNVTLTSLRSAIGFVGQDTFLFSDTILENLRMGRPGATDDEVIEAAKIAHAHEFISGFADGYQTKVGENGTFLSGGQKQRIAIARAVLRNASILLLDEATSALDSHSETLVQDALERVTNGVTTIVIAHRLSTILNADCVAYVKDGEIVEHGTVKELIAKPDGKFRALFDEQFRHAGITNLD